MISLFELFKIGIGPSSSHTVGPMIATQQFAMQLASECDSKLVYRITVELYGSLALTGIGHATDRAVLLGLQGEHPESVDPMLMTTVIDTIQRTGKLVWLGQHTIEMRLESDLLFHRQLLRTCLLDSLNLLGLHQV